MQKRILLVEDEPVVSAMMRDILELILGQQVRTAEDGLEAIQVARQYRPDLILMDLNLPKLDGWEVTRSLKKTEEFRDTPILAITAHTMVGDRENALRAGCDDYLPKPVDVDTFIAFMQPYLAN